MNMQTSPRRRAGSEQSVNGVLDIVYRSLTTALRELCAREYNAGVTVHRAPGQPERGTATLRIQCRGLGALSAQLTVCPVDDSLYEVRCTINDRPARRFSFSQPDEFGVRLSVAPVLGAQIANDLLDALKREVGDRVLRSAAGPPSRSSRSLRN